MAYVIASEGLHDQAFLDRHVLGFDEAHLPPGAPAGASYRSYLLGSRTACARRRSGRQTITGMPAATLRRLADRVRDEQAGGPALRLRAGPHDPRRAVPPRGLRAGRDDGQRRHPRRQLRHQQRRDRPLRASGSCPRARTRPARAWPRRCSPICSMRGRAGGYPADIKMIYSAAGDLFNQLPNVRKIIAAAEQLEFMVVHDHFITPTARYADIVLPATTFWERNDVHTPWAGAGHYAIFMQQAIEPVGECRNDLDICTDLARRLGIEGYNDKTEDAVAARADARRDRRLRHVPRARPGAAAGARGRGRLRARDPRPRAPSVHDAVREDRDLLDDAGREARPLRARRDPADPDVDPRRARRRAIRCGWSRRSRARARTRSTTTSRCSSRADRDDVWINPADAAARGIADGQRVRVFNDRGATQLPARVTDRIAPGVVSIKEGAWFTPDAAGQDTRGCANVLTRTGRRRRGRARSTPASWRSRGPEDVESARSSLSGRAGIGFGRQAAVRRSDLSAGQLMDGYDGRHQLGRADCVLVLTGFPTSS